MVVYLSDDPNEELRIIEQAEAQWRRGVARGSNWAPERMSAVVGWIQSASWMDPEAMFSLVESGIRHDSPEGREILAVAGDDYWTGWRQGSEPNEVSIASRRFPTGGGVAGSLSAAAPEAEEAQTGGMRAGFVSGNAAKGGTVAVQGTDQAVPVSDLLADPAVQMALGTTPIERVLAGEMTARSVMETVRRMPGNEDATWGDIVNLHNNAVEARTLLARDFGFEFLKEHAETPFVDFYDPAHVSAAAGGARDEHAAFEQIAGYLSSYVDEGDAVAALNGQVDAATPVAFMEQFRPGEDEGPADLTETLIRGAMIAVNAPIQELTGLFRETVGQVRSEGWAHLFDAVVGAEMGAVVPGTGLLTRMTGTDESQSDLGVIASQLRAGEQVDTGSGFFVHPGSGVGRERYAREMQHGNIGGQVITPGRWMVDAFTGLDPGDTGYGAASGLVDFAWTIGADPLNLLGTGAAKAAQARRVFTGAGSLGDELVEGAARAADDLLAPSTAAPAAGAPSAADALARLDTAPRRIDVPEPRVPDEIIRQEDAGLLPRALVPDLTPGTVSHWLTTKGQRGRAAVEAIANETDALALAEATGFRFRPSVYPALADATDIDDVTRILFDEIAGLRAPGLDRTFQYTPGGQVRLPESLGGAPVGVPNTQRGTWARRNFGDMPVSTIDLRDPRAVAMGVRDILVNARVPKEQIAVRVRQAMEDAQTQVGANAVIKGALKDVREALVARGQADRWRWGSGLDDDAAEAVTRVIELHQLRNRLFYLMPDGENAAMLPEMRRVLANGKIHAEPIAHLSIEMAPDVIHIPNIREIKRLTSVVERLGPLIINQDPTAARFVTGKVTGRTITPGAFTNVGNVIRAVDFLSTTVWKRATLLRLAWPIRQVLIDEQLRMAASGMPSMWRNPIHFVAAVLVDAKTEQRLLRALDEANPGFAVSREFQASMMGRGLIDATEIRRMMSGGWFRVKFDDPQYVEAWGRELGQLAAEPVAARLASGVTAEQVTDDLMRGDLAPLRREIGLNNLPESMADEVGVRRWVDSQWQRIEEKTMRNPELKEAIANGYLRGTTKDGTPTKLFFSDPQTWKPTAGFEPRLAGFKDEWGPPEVKMENEIPVPGSGGVSEAMNAVTNVLFDLAAARPSNRLSRSVAFRHYYLESLAERFPFLTREAQDAIIARAVQWKVATGVEIGGVRLGGGELMDALQRARATGKVGTVGFDDADLFGRFEAMERTKRLIGDFTQKNHMADAFRVIIPFGAAWREALGSYYSILKRNPLIVRRPVQGVEAAGQAGWIAPDANGEWMFNYPGAGTMMQMGGGPPFPLTGRVQGLTMGMEVIPGFGPVAQLPLSWLVPNTPRFDWIRENFMPYGVEKGQSIFMPEWAEKLFNGMANSDNGLIEFVGFLGGGGNRDSVQAFGSSMGDVMRWMISTGDWEGRTPDEFATEAQKLATHMWFWRGLAQFVAPAAPRPNPMFETQDGDLILIAPMQQRLAELYEEDPLNAGARFLEEFGDLAYGILEAKTESNALYTPRDTAGYNWVREHEGLMDSYPEIAALFAPRSGDEAGISAYMAELDSGRQRVVDPVVWFKRAQDSLASILYRRDRQAAEAAAVAAGYEPGSALPADLQAWLNTRRAELMDQYPGYLSEGQTISDIRRTITDLRHAMEREEVFAESDAGQALADYLAFRDQAIAQLGTAGLSSLSSETARPLRDWLRGEGERLVGEHPDFINLWERVFSREVELVEEEA